jgi:hypothetical protein
MLLDLCPFDERFVKDCKGNLGFDEKALLTETGLTNNKSVFYKLFADKNGSLFEKQIYFLQTEDTAV